jgi:hypothetical protein
LSGNRAIKKKRKENRRLDVDPDKNKPHTTAAITSIPSTNPKLQLAALILAATDLAVVTLFRSVSHLRPLRLAVLPGGGTMDSPGCAKATWGYIAAPHQGTLADGA